MEGSRPSPAMNTGSRKSNLSDDIWSDIADVFKLENRTDGHNFGVYANDRGLWTFTAFVSDQAVENEKFKKIRWG